MWRLTNTIKCFCLGTIGLIVALGNVMFFKLDYLPDYFTLRGKIFFLRTPNFREQLSVDSSSTETLLFN